mgnify:CR=1 FL=1
MDERNRACTGETSAAAVTTVAIPYRYTKTHECHGNTKIREEDNKKDIQIQQQVPSGVDRSAACCLAAAMFSKVNKIGFSSAGASTRQFATTHNHRHHSPNKGIL